MKEIRENFENFPFSKTSWYQSIPDPKSSSRSHKMTTDEQTSSPPEVLSESYLTAPVNHTLVDQTPSFVTGHRLNGSNYLQWSSSVLMFIWKKGRDKYLTGELLVPPANDQVLIHGRWRTVSSYPGW